MKKKKRLLFLDFDGVINTFMIYREKINGHCVEKDGYYIDLGHPNYGHVSNKQALTWVEKLCKEYNLEIVITSTWVIGYTLEKLRECLYNSGLDKSVKVIGMCEHNIYIRGQAIESYFYDKDYKTEDCIIIVLDDDSDMIGIKHDYSRYLVKTNTYVGFSIEDYEKACSILDEQIELEMIEVYNEEE